MAHVHDDSPTAFIAMPFTEDLRPLFENVIRPALEAEGIRAARADEIPKGGVFTDNIFAEIERASLVVGVTTGANANVAYELGYAYRLRKETILMVDDPASIPADLRHIHHLVYSLDDLGKARDTFAGWINASTVQSCAIAESIRPSVLRRGEVFDNVVDGTFYLQRERPLPSKAEITQYLEHGQGMPQRLLYLTEEGQTAYLQLCNDPEYVYYRETSILVSEAKREIAELVSEHCESTELDFISLGPGNGQKDAVLLDEFCRKVRPQKYTYYYPYDVSGGLLLESMRNILAKGLPAFKLRVKAIEADIQHLPALKRVLDFREEPNVYSLLGGLSNMGSETTLLRLLHRMMNPEDCLLVEVRRKGAPETGDAIGQVDLNRRLDLAPLTYVGARLEAEAIRYMQVDSRSSIPATRTVVGKIPRIILDDRTYRDVELFHIHYYDEESLSERLRSEGFNIVRQFDKPHSLLYLLTKCTA